MRKLATGYFANRLLFDPQLHKPGQLICCRSDAALCPKLLMPQPHHVRALKISEPLMGAALKLPSFFEKLKRHMDEP